MKILDVAGFAAGAMSELIRGRRGPDDDPPPAARGLQRPNASGPGFHTPYFPPVPPTGGASAIAGNRPMARPMTAAGPAALIAGAAAAAVDQARPQLAYGLTRAWQVLQNTAHNTLGDFNGSVRVGQDAARPRSQVRDDPHAGKVDLARAESTFNQELTNGSQESLDMQSGKRPVEQLPGHFRKMSEQLRTTISELQTTNPDRAARYIARIPSLDNYIPEGTQFTFSRNPDGVLQVRLD